MTKTKSAPVKMATLTRVWKEELKQAKQRRAQDQKEVAIGTKDVEDITAELAEASRFLSMAKTGIRHGLKELVKELRLDLVDTKGDLAYAKKDLIKSEQALAKLLK